MSTGKKKRKKLDTLSYILYFRYLDDNLYNEMGKKRAIYSSLHFLIFKYKKKFNKILYYDSTMGQLKF